MEISKFKNIFISEAEDHIQMLNDNLLSVEKILKNNKSGKNINDKKYKELLDELMRSAHTIKSSAATMGYSKMAFLMHVLEDVFDYARNGLFIIKINMISELLGAIDAIEESIKNIKDKNIEIDLDNYSKKIKKLTGVATLGIGVSKRGKDGSPVIKKEDIISEKEETGLATSSLIEPVTDKILHIKVPVKRLDDLMNLTEELLIEKMRLNSLIKKNDENDPISILESLRPAMEHLSSLVSSLQYQVMQSRLVPAGQIFARFPRMVRDLSAQNGKEIEFIIKGEDLEMDRSIIDKLGEPLIHLLRNSIDHGISKSGHIILEAKRDKDFASIIIEDNGSGINWKKLVESAITRNIISGEKGQEFLDQIKNSPQPSWQPLIEKELLYNPRLSTKEVITETSGRGVGTSVVKKFMEEIGGEIVVISPINEQGGTRFILNLPLTLAIIKALLVEIDGFTFAIPFSGIERAVFLQNEDIKSIADQDVAVVDGREVVLVSLEKIFNLLEIFNNNKINKSIPNKTNDKKIAVLVQRGADTAGFLVDRLLNEQEIIVKPLPSVLNGVKGFSGSTILGDGDTILILDIVSFLKDTNKLTHT